VLAAAAIFAGTPVSPETQCLLAGLAIVAAMPVGGTAAAWTANHGGDPALGLGVLAGSLAASPVTVPAGLAVGSLMTFGDLADDLDRMTSVTDGLRGMVTAVLPAAVGVVLRTLWPGLVAASLPLLRILTVADVAGLAYLNASGLPRGVLFDADPEFLAAVVAAALLMCAGTFAAGWLLARCGRCSAQDTVALTYTTGMTNASLGAIVACTGLREHTMVLVPILAVSILQTIAAGWVGRLVSRGWRRSEALSAG
jgi:BASS family bile acid:Na+ symporter